MAMALVFLTLGITQTDLARRLKAGLSPAAAHLQAPPLPPTSWVRGLDGSILGGFDGFESELAENELEFMAKDMRTQPTSLNSILESQNLDSG